jgi:predicted glycoside hydrolase/deacetylase ChbG (UPF0249 family)
MPAERRLIVNADDFGLSPGVNEGVARAHEHGIVTSASLMVRWRAADEAASYARANPRLAVGLHLDLGDWVFRDSAWAENYQVVALEDAEAVAHEARAQLARFRELLGRDPTHFDSHQHVHTKMPEHVEAALAEVTEPVGVPVRHRTPAVAYRGDFYGQTNSGETIEGALTADNLIAIIRALPAGVSELACHPGLGRDFDSPYLAEREQEVAALCDPRVRAALEQEGIALCSFSEVV